MEQFVFREYKVQTALFGLVGIAALLLIALEGVNYVTSV